LNSYIKNTQIHKISAALITFNEAKNINRTLNQLTWCDEIIIVDSFSTDKTLEICKNFNVKIIQKEFNGYGEQKQFLVSQCANKWILSIDADEVLSDELITEIQTEFSKKIIPFDAYYLKRKHIYLGKKFNYGKLKSEPILRLFNKNTCAFTAQKVHEKVIYNNKSSKFKNLLFHYTATSIKQIMYKKNRYATLSSEEYFKKGKRVGLFALVFKYPSVFIKEYIFHLNFLNGYEGYVWSVYLAEYSSLKYIKLRELNRKANFEQPI
jgi:glycosyltransferase involved in cell wall biosynthesis